LSWKSVSTASTATAGADMVLSRLPSFISGPSRRLPSGVRTNRTRSGLVLAIVGGHLASSVISCSCSSVTGTSENVFAVRAATNSSSRPSASSAIRSSAVRESSAEVVMKAPRQDS